jgi:chemotaxis protein methyltransferase CheR
MKSDLLQDVAALVAKRAGITIEPSTAGRLLTALIEEAGSRGTSPEAFAGRLDRDAEAFQALLDRITVQETSFFRDPRQFEALASIAASVPEPVTVWSAGCANGQEAYSLAMTFAESEVENWKVLATDISTRALARTRRARYVDREIGGLSSERRAAFLAPRDHGWEVVASLRDRVSILRHNLVSDPPPFAPGACSIVFCRNVLIYLRRSEVIRFLDRLHERMHSDGLLFLGFSESLWQISDRFRLLRIGDAFVYRPCGEDPSGERRVSRGQEAEASTVPIPPPAIQSVRPDESSGDLLAAGETAEERGDHATAAASFRRAAYLDPENPLAHFHLGLALEALGDRRSAHRAFRAAAVAIETSSNESIQGGLGGFGSNDFVQVLRSKLESPGS